MNNELKYWEFYTNSEQTATLDPEHNQKDKAFWNTVEGILNHK